LFYSFVLAYLGDEPDRLKIWCFCNKRFPALIIRVAAPAISLNSLDFFEKILLE